MASTNRRGALGQAFRDPERWRAALVSENLGGDALLIAPSPVGPPEAYPHLAAFLRLAPEAQVRSLWRHAAGALRENLGDDPRWLSTSGLGVAWLHLRLDRSPKYYQFEPYRAGS